MALDWKDKLSRLGAGGAAGLPGLVTLLLGAMLAYQAASLTWTLLPPPDNAAPPPPRTDVAGGGQAAGNDAVSLSRAIAARHLLGQTQTVRVRPVETAIPETRLRLTLRGVMALDDSGTGAAVIADPAGKEALYHVGDTLPGGAKLKAVHPQHVVLSRRGRLETLRLPRNAVRVGATPSRRRPGAAPPRVAPDAGARLRSYRDQFLKNPASLAGLLRGEPVRRGGRLIGFRVRPGRDAQVLSTFGLRDGDVITAVNGIKLGEPGGTVKLMRELPRLNPVVAEFQRDGMQQSVTITLPP